MYCRAALSVLYAFFVVFVIVDVVVHTRNYCNLVSLSGIFVFLTLAFFFSVAPRKVCSLIV